MNVVLRIDPLAYNREVDDTLELDEVLHPSKELHDLLSSIDRTKVKPWILTNAYIKHAKRVMKLLDIEPFFEGPLPLSSDYSYNRDHVLRLWTGCTSLQTQGRNVPESNVRSWRQG